MAFNYRAFYTDWKKNHAISQADRLETSLWQTMNYGGESRQYQTLTYNLARLVAFKFKTSPLLPYDTGNFMKNGIVPLPVNKTQAKVRFGNQHVPYAYYLNFNEFVGATQVPNRHLGFVEKVIEGGLLSEIRLAATQEIFQQYARPEDKFFVIDPWNM